MMHPKEYYDQCVRYADRIMDAVRSELKEKRTKTDPPLTDLESTFQGLVEIIRQSTIGSDHYPSTASEVQVALNNLHLLRCNVRELGKRYQEHGFHAFVSMSGCTGVGTHYRVLEDNLAGKSRSVSFPTLSIRYSHFPPQEVPPYRASLHGIKPVADAHCKMLNKASGSYAAECPKLYPVPGRTQMFYIGFGVSNAHSFLCMEQGTIYSPEGGVITFKALEETPHDEWDVSYDLSCRDTFMVFIPKNGSISVTKELLGSYGYVIHDAILIQYQSVR